ncbi:hypothetical protein OPV22_014349 [Ensete ventricosum]|uniref:Uncharacterized protein n=1 Tax=Ensete ventricosum TaxID=4639 RepID=A0AAV8R9I9_ENSVE|nr:hypothetical protein OPV22_014349 [Ensete ventricosum]
MRLKAVCCLHDTVDPGWGCSARLDLGRVVWVKAVTISVAVSIIQRLPSVRTAQETAFPSLDLVIEIRRKRKTSCASANAQFVQPLSYINLVAG